MKKFLRKLGKFLFILFTIFVACTLLVFAGFWGYQQYKDYKLGKYLRSLPTDPMISTDVTVELYGDETIGENKMTIREKVEAGLNPYVTDTSGNGISDWDAVHTYHTDPKKFSSADDGISDLAKIKEGLDPTKPLDINTIDEFTIENEALDVAIHTNDLNAKHHTFIEPYQQSELEAVYEPVREPVQFFNYEGEIELGIPDGVKNPEKLKAFYFDFDKEDFVEIKDQRIEDNALIATINNFYPVYILDPDTYDQIEKYYYFRVSGFQFSRAVAGFDHKIFLFKRGLFDSEKGVEEKFEDPDYGITELSIGKIGPISAALLDRLYALLDRIFQPLDNTDGSWFQRALLDYGTVTGTPEYAQKYVMPWMYEDEILETENEDSWKVIDTGFRSKKHAFKFGNMMTKIGDGGICAGYCRVTERVFNGQEIEKELSYDPETWRSKLVDWLGDHELSSSLSYNLEPQLSHYSFLNDGMLYNYSFTDEQMAHLGISKFLDGDLVVEPDTLTEPDQTLIKMLETQWMYSNEFINYKTKPYDTNNLEILDQVDEALSNGQIIYVSLHGNSSGHAVNVYKMEYDRYDPNLIRLYVYDSNFPHGRLKKEGKDEVYINIYKRKKNTLFGTEEYFEFDYTPFESRRADYSYSNVDKNNEIRFFINDEAFKGN
ncbi:hypothetical protein [Bacillus niameyensis]|uniref:hypothetical protein n=1 Tax=Bacillus niameyensis TaxID=1522308 RepID=UPI000783DA33|nr:hypothetical protein [Bacillus niameyensis]